jgi:hypothetical protein
VVRRKARSQPTTKKKTQPQTQKKTQPQTQKKRKIVAARQTRPRRKPAVERQRAIKTRAVVPAAARSSGSSSLLLPLALGAALGLSLLVAVLALTPQWALPGRAQELVYGRREVLAFVGFAAALSIGLALTFAVS